MRPFLTAAMLVPLALPAAALEIEPRVAGQLTVSRAGFEPGGALEISFGSERNVLIRPELFFNDDADLAWGGSVLWRLPLRRLPLDHALYFGPRFADHDADEWGIGVDAMAMYDLPLGRGGHHWLEFIALAGFIEDVEGDDNENEPNVGVAAAYAYEF